MRSLSALCSSLLPIPIYVLGRSQGGHQLGLWAALVTALSPFQIYYGQEARVYSMAALMAAVCSLCVWRFLFGAKPVASGLLYSICAIVGVFSHYAFLFLLPFHGGWALFEMWRRPQRRHWMVVVPIVSMGLALTAWYLVLEAQQDFMALSSPFFEGRVGLLETFSMLARIPLRLVAGDNLWSKLVYASLIGGLALASVSAWRRWVDEWRAVWFATCWVLTPLTLHMAADLIVGNHTVTVTRYSMLNLSWGLPARGFRAGLTRGQSEAEKPVARCEARRRHHAGHRRRKRLVSVAASIRRQVGDARIGAIPRSASQRAGLGRGQRTPGKRATGRLLPEGGGHRVSVSSFGRSPAP